MVLASIQLLVSIIALMDISKLVNTEESVLAVSISEHSCSSPCKQNTKGMGIRRDLFCGEY